MVEENSNTPYAKLNDSFSPKIKKLKKDSIARWQQLTTQVDVVSKWQEYVSCRRRIHNKKLTKMSGEHREGPAPKGAVKMQGTFETLNSTHKGIDSDIGEDEDLDDFRSSFTTELTGSLGERPASRKKPTSANSRALIIYFSKLAGSSSAEDVIDLDFVDGLVENGADVNATDTHGQTVFHEVARAWHVDVAKFLIQKNADINKADRFGRTPLHVASAVNYPEMVEFLCKNGGKFGVNY